MIFEYLKKQKELKNKRKLLITSILSLNIDEMQKQLYIEATEILEIDGINELFDNLVHFTESMEMKELDEINKQNFSTVAGMRKKEAEEKKKELNSFGFLINNI